MSLAKASGRRSSINIGRVEVSSSKIDAMSTNKKPKVINFADVVGNKPGEKYNGQAVRRDYSSAAGVIKRASKAGGASIAQRHLPKFRPATVVVADDDEQGWHDREFAKQPICLACVSERDWRKKPRRRRRKLLRGRWLRGRNEEEGEGGEGEAGETAVS